MWNLSDSDQEIVAIIKSEIERQDSSVVLVASENFVSKAVMEAQGSVLTNKYAEGYPSKRYYSGCNIIDKAECLAIDRAKILFNCRYANVQPHSGSQANQAVFFSLLKPGDNILGMSLTSGGHLSHGTAFNISGKCFHSKFYDVHEETHLIDYEKIEELAKLYKPKLIIAGYSSYSREIDFRRFRIIADKVGAYLMADIAHIAGLVATGYHQNPLPFAHVTTSTTHKTLRGPRGGIIMTNDELIAKKINKSVFPGIQGGPFMHTIAAKAVAFKEALNANYNAYIKQVIVNAKVLSLKIQERGFKIVTGGTDNHMMVIDLKDKNISGEEAAKTLEKLSIICNKNTIPFDTKLPSIASGIRIGTPACTTRGFKEQEFIIIANLIADVLENIQSKSINANFEKKIHDTVRYLTKKSPLDY